MSKISYIKNQPIKVADLASLYNSVGWTSYTDHPEIMTKLLPGALSYISAWDGDDLIGLVRTIGDGCYILYIQDLLVHPDYQRRGIGSDLIHQILDDAKDMRQIILTTDSSEKTAHFYRSVGLVPMNEAGVVSFIKEV